MQVAASDVLHENGAVGCHRGSFVLGGSLELIHFQRTQVLPKFFFSLIEVNVSNLYISYCMSSTETPGHNMGTTTISPRKLSHFIHETYFINETTLTSPRKPPYFVRGNNFGSSTQIILVRPRNQQWFLSANHLGWSMEAILIHPRNLPIFSYENCFTLLMQANITPSRKLL